MNGSSAESTETSASNTQQNIQTILAVERAARCHRSVGERISDFFVRYMGTIGFVLAHAIGFALWVIVNLGLVPDIRPFDPFPFGILTLIVSTEGVFLAIFILISQNRMTRQADQRAHLDLQISLLNEQETTKLIQMLQALSDHFGLGEQAHDQRIEQLSHETQIETLVHDVQEKLVKEE